jgi:hypothetical protein
MDGPGKSSGRSERPLSDLSSGGYAESMSCFRLNYVLILGLAFVCSCRSEPKQHVSHSDRDTIETMTERVRRAPDGPSEAEALRRLHDWAADEKVTYDFKAYPLGGRVPIEHPSAYSGPVEAELTFYRAMQPFHTFRWVPRDKRNLGIMAAGA